MEAFEIIYNNLKNGMKYGKFEKGYTEYFWEVLSYYSLKNMWVWTHYGSSMNKATKAELKWILETIFEMTAEEFVENYSCYSESEIIEKLFPEKT